MFAGVRRSLFLIGLTVFVAAAVVVLRGLRSRAYETGRFSAKRENGVYHFQNLVREFLGDGA